MDISNINEAVKNVAKDKVLFKEGKPADKFYVIKSGAVLAFKIEQDRLIPLYVAEGKQSVGEDCVLQGVPYTYHAVTIEETELVEIPEFQVRKVMEKAPLWMANLILTISERFDSTSNAIKEHKIIDPSLTAGRELSTEDLNRFKKMVLSKS